VPALRVEAPIALPSMDVDDPILEKFRKDNVDPIETYDKTDNDDPVFTKFLMDMLL
jgi:hypothetical protein